MSAPLAVGDYPNAAGIRLAHRVAESLDSRAPIVLLADLLCGEPWLLHYADATKVVGAALRQPLPGGTARDI